MISSLFNMLFECFAKRWQISVWESISYWPWYITCTIINQQDKSLNFFLCQVTGLSWHQWKLYDYLKINFHAFQVVSTKWWDIQHHNETERVTQILGSKLAATSWIVIYLGTKTSHNSSKFISENKEIISPYR